MRLKNGLWGGEMGRIRKEHTAKTESSRLAKRKGDRYTSIDFSSINDTDIDLSESSRTGTNIDLGINKNADSAVKPAYLLKMLSDIMNDDDAIITTEVGQNQIWAANNLTIRKRAVYNFRWYGNNGIWFTCCMVLNRWS